MTITGRKNPEPSSGLSLIEMKGQARGQATEGEKEKEIERRRKDGKRQIKLTLPVASQSHFDKPSTSEIDLPLTQNEKEAEKKLEKRQEKRKEIISFEGKNDKRVFLSKS